MLQGDNTDLFNLLVPKAHNSECQNLLPYKLFPLQIKPVKSAKAFLWIFIFAPSALMG